MTTAQQPIRVSRFARILAWVFLGFVVLTVGSVIKLVIDGKDWPWSLPLSIAFGFGSVVFVALVGYVAVKGYSPRWWAAYEAWASKRIAIARRRRMTAFGYRDLFYADGRPGVTVRATLTLLFSETAGGRRSDLEVRWRPNHNFGPPDGREFYIGQVEFDTGKDIEPGQTRTVIVRFLDGPGLRDQLMLGRSWRVQEGPRLVAKASVLEVFRD